MASFPIPPISSPSSPPFPPASPTLPFVAPTSRYPYVTLTLNFSQMYALYCLLVIYDVMWSYLAHIRPLGKFLAIKAVVFVTWWQAVLLAALFSFHVLRAPAGAKFGDLQYSNAIQDFLVCLEVREKAGGVWEGGREGGRGWRVVELRHC